MTRDINELLGRGEALKDGDEFNLIGYKVEKDPAFGKRATLYLDNGQQKGTYSKVVIGQLIQLKEKTQTDNWADDPIKCKVKSRVAEESGQTYLSL